MTASNPSLIIVPARMASTRLPGKPLADILGEPMIVHVWRRAVEADVGPVVVACAEAEIADAVRAAGGHAVLTRPDHPSGSDRIEEAARIFDPDGRHETVINLQGDLPTLDPAAIRAVVAPLDDPDVDIATLVAEIVDPEERDDPNAVKAVVSLAGGERQGRALWFTRLPAPGGEGPCWHHIGIYAYRRRALERFVALAPTPLEKRERLEQLRALEHGFHIAAAVVDTVPLGVDTPADLARIREIAAARAT
ncbi:3-deoxy-manno-octulosonate cytidylyltransferase [Oceanibacterium hippocampi]|uniref:3-deoxy-manno-octulosonate cytidylyltransferase n=1 Tax=Oceanibacterium hippocampi TaxID=745714 RepID=A0A1Y5RVH7_9PROT|nr:3-deoxy-manno-octulosonate cytidylyltransferase [Oceanibacterium hippocampi]SLN25220.1 3-deoxy-manno-octulosonate cytidylyltransferase [Oceanibacterium hippocampi]